MTERPFSVVVAGVGRFGALHARVWTEAGATVAGLCDVDAQRLTQVAQRFPQARTGENLRELLADVRPDAVVVASDEASHVDLAEVALEAGAHVLVEKPLALSSADAWRLHDRSVELGRHVVTGHISRFAAPYAHMRRALTDGRVGDLCALRFRRDFSHGWFVAFGDRVHPAWESSIHDIDLAIAFTGQPVRRVTAVSSSAAGPASPAVTSALLELEGGVIATVESAWLLPDAAPQTVSGALELSGTISGEAEVLGRSGVLRQRLVADNLVEWTAEGTSAPDLLLWPEEDGAVGGALRREVDYAIAVFAGHRLPDVMPLEQACWGIEATEALVASLQARRPVDVRRRASGGQDP